MILKRILSGGEVSRLHRDGEGYTITNSGEPHPNRPPAFSLAAKGAKKKLGKKKRRPSPFEKGPGLPKQKNKNVG